MDRTDYQILNILQKDSRTTLKAIGSMVGLTSPAVSERIHRMECAGVIRNFSVNIDRSQIDYNVTGFTLVALRPEAYDAFCSFCEAEPAVICHYHLVGTFNAMIRFAVFNVTSLEIFLHQIKQFGNSRTSIELGTYFASKDIELPVATIGKLSSLL